MTHAVVGSSIFADDDFLALPFEAKATFLLLQPWAATTEGGRFGMVAALKHIESMGAPGSIWQVLVDADMIRPDGKKWYLAGWDKHQPCKTTDTTTEGPGDRPTTRAGRELARGLKVLPDGWERQWDAAEEFATAERTDTLTAPWRTRAVDVPPREVDVPPRGGHGSDTPSPVGPPPPSPSPPSPTPLSTPPTPTPTPTPTPCVVSSPGARTLTGGEFNPDQRDIRDTLYELTLLPPWGRAWGDDALKVEIEYGFEVLDPVVRESFRELSFTRKPWQIIRHADAVLSRRRAMVKEQEAKEARIQRAARQGEPSALTKVGLDPAEYEAKAKEYHDA